jgi:hypothetical protein
MRAVFRRTADGTGDRTLLAEPGGSPDWSSDGEHVLYSASGDVFYVELQTNGAVSEPRLFFSGPASQSNPKLSPTGDLVAYISNESSRNEIYIQPFPEATGRIQVSVNGGTQPLWRRDGRELYYVEGDVLMAVSVGAPGGVEPRPPTATLPVARFSQPQFCPKLRRFCGRTKVPNGNSSRNRDHEAPSIRIAQNWYEEFRDREQ